MHHFMFQRGFTIVEVMVVSAIIGIMAMIAVPNFLLWVDHYRVKSAARDIVSGMQSARLKAISQAVEYRVEFDLDNETFRLQKGNMASGSTNWTNEGTLMAVHSSVDIDRVDSATSGLRYKQFNPGGSSSSGSIRLDNPRGEQYRITLVPATGRIKMERIS